MVLPALLTQALNVSELSEITVNRRYWQMPGPSNYDTTILLVRAPGGHDQAYAKQNRRLDSGHS